MITSGVNCDELDGDELTDVAYSMIIDDIMEMGVARIEARETIDKRLADIQMRQTIREGKKPEPEPFRLDSAFAAKMGIKLPKPAGESP